MNVVLGLDLFLIGLGLLVGLVVGLAILAAPDSSLAKSQHQDYVKGITSWSAIFLNFVFLGGIPFVWVAVTRQDAWEGTKRYFGFHTPLRSLGIGAGLAGWFVGPILLLGFLLSRGHGAASDASTSQIVATPAILLVFTALSAGLGEEIFFRGLLYRWTGWWAQALFFALAHFANGAPLQLGIALGIGLLFGWLRRAGWSLWALVAAHTVYDGTLLLVGKYAPGFWGS